MKKVLVFGLVVVTLGLLAGFAIPVFAHGLDGDVPIDQESWEAMHKGCETGDWEAMAEAAEEVHGENIGAMPCHGEDYDSSGEESGSSTSGWGGMGGGMGGGMMGGGMGSGMMDW